ncbi:MAG TPA: GLPGLI family protein, partial [Chryseobacterium sp.]|nr:GLPGLI family protein [Chryseobacterium sp.]
TDDSSQIKIEATKLVLNAENANISFKPDTKYSKVNWDGYVQTVEKDFGKQVKFYKSIASQQGAEVELDLKFENMEYVSKKDENN